MHLVHVSIPLAGAVVQRKRAEENEIKRQQREELAAKREEVSKGT